jgi:hypothetical protein
MELDDDEKPGKSDPPKREAGGKRRAVSVKDDLDGDIEFDLIDEVDSEDTINDVFARDTAIPAPSPQLAAEPSTEEPVSAETIRPFDEDEIEQGLKLATDLSAPSSFPPPPPMRPMQHTPITMEPADEDLEFDTFDLPVDHFEPPIHPHAVTPRPQHRFGQSEMPTAPPVARRDLLEQAKRSMPAPDARRGRPAFMTETARNPPVTPDPRARGTLPGTSTSNGRAARGARSDPAKDSALDFVDQFDPLDSLPAGPMSGLEAPEPPSSKPRAGPKEMQECYAVGDFSRALSIAEEILARSPDDVLARRCAQNCRDVLTQMFAARIGPLDQIISVVISPEEVQWLALDHRAGFLLSLVDGQSTVDEILDISGMTRLDALKIIFDLTERQVVRLA